MTVIPFCPCMHKPDYEGGLPLGKDDEGMLTWGPHECDVLDAGQIYAAVAGHRRTCERQPELRSEPVSGEAP